MSLLHDYYGWSLTYAIRFEAPNGLGVEIPAGAVLTAGPRGEVLVDGKPVTWQATAAAPGPRVLNIVPASKIGASEVSPGDVLSDPSTTHGGGAGT